LYTNNTQLQGNSDIIIDKWTTADSNSMQWTKISSIRSQQLAFPHSNRHKQITNSVRRGHNFL